MQNRAPKLVIMIALGKETQLPHSSNAMTDVEQQVGDAIFADLDLKPHPRPLEVLLKPAGF